MAEASPSALQDPTASDIPSGARASPARSVPSVKGKERADNVLDQADVMGKPGDVTDEEEDDDDDDAEESEGAIEMDEEDYERERQRRIEENKLLLDSLGFSSLQASSSFASLHAGPSRLSQPSSTSQPPRKKRPKISAPVYNRSGHILSLPRPGETHVIACVEIPSDRRLKRRIADGEYADCVHWAEGEERRWRYGRERGGELAEGEEKEEYVSGIGKEFRWRRWKGLEKELRRELRKRGEMNEADQEGVDEGVQEEPVKLAEGVSAYSLIPGAPCHQCRRKSDKLKMTCRNLAPECRAVFCETCCKRQSLTISYSYFDFDAESRTFICPLCRNCCNCANCIRKRNLAHLLDGKKGLNRTFLRKAVGGGLGGVGREGGSEGIGQGETIQDVLAKAVEGHVGVPFDFVRIVTQAEDVVSPDLPPEVVPPVPKKVPIGSKAKKGKKGRPKIAKGVKESMLPGEQKGYGVMPGGDGQDRQPITLKSRRPPPAPAKWKRVKEVDSDGDTVGGYSSDDAESSLTSLATSSGAAEAGGGSSSLPIIARRSPFPPRPPQDLRQQSMSINDYLSSLSNQTGNGVMSVSGPMGMEGYLQQSYSKQSACSAFYHSPPSHSIPIKVGGKAFPDYPARPLSSASYRQESAPVLIDPRTTGSTGTSTIAAVDSQIDPTLQGEECLYPSVMRHSVSSPRCGSTHQNIPDDVTLEHRQSYSSSYQSGDVGAVSKYNDSWTFSGHHDPPPYSHSPQHRPVYLPCSSQANQQMYEQGPTTSVADDDLGMDEAVESAESVPLTNNRTHLRPIDTYTPHYDPAAHASMLAQYYRDDPRYKGIPRPSGAGSGDQSGIAESRYG